MLLSEPQKKVLTAMIGTLAVILIMLLNKKVTMNTMSKLFIGSTILNIILLKVNAIHSFVKCFQGLLPMLLMIGFENSIPMMLEQANVIDTIIYFL